METAGNNDSLFGNLSVLLNATDRPPSQKIDHCLHFNFVFYGLVIGALCILGLFGNVLSIIVIQKDRNNKVAGFLLQSLAFVDNAVLLISFIVFSLIYGILPYIFNAEWNRTAHSIVMKYIHPLGYMAQTGTIWLTVLLALNRYIAICLPFQAAKLCTRTRVRMQVAVITTFSVVFNIPRFFQYSLRFKNNYYVAEETVIGESTVFGIVYTNALYSILVLLLPLLLLLFLKGRLVMEMHRMKQRRRAVGCDIYPKEENITLVMIIIVVVFLFCHTPDRILQIVKYVVPATKFYCGSPLFYYLAVCNLLILVNSSTNFLVYYFIRRRFRKILKAKLCCCLLRGRHSKKKVNGTYQSDMVLNDTHRLSLLSNTEVTNSLNHINGKKDSHL